MIIALFSDTYLPNKNGVATSLSQLKTHLSTAGHTVYIYTVSVPEHKEEDSFVFRAFGFAPPLKMGTSENRFAVVNIPKLLMDLKKKNVQLIHTHSEFNMGLYGRYLSKMLKIPHIHTCHTMWSDYRHYLSKLVGMIMQNSQIEKFYKHFVSRCSAVVAPSPKAAYFLNNIGVKSYLVNNGVDESMFNRNVNEADKLVLREKYGFTKDNTIILFVGRIAPEKSVIHLYKILKNVCNRNSNNRALFVGDGTDIKELREMAIADNLTDKIVFTGFMSYQDMAPYYYMADIYTTVSTSEVQPMTIIEALIASLPVVVKEDLAYVGLVDNEINGYVYSDDKQIEDAIVKLSTDEKLREQFSSKSFLKSKHFTAKRQADEMAVLYEKAIEIGRPKNKYKFPLEKS